MYSNNNIDLRFLKDLKKDGKDNNWKNRKENNLLLAESYKRLSNKKYKRVVDCATFLEFKVTNDNRLKLSNANFCKVRLCPVCAWRRSLKIFGQVSKIMNYCQSNHDFKYIFLTLTVKNCYAPDLKDTLESMIKGYNAMSRKKAFKQGVKGYFKALEITYNKENDMYHPHFHLILAVNKSYFSDSRVYLSHSNFVKLWKESLKVDYSPVVDIRVVKADKDKDISKAVSEIAKYTVKSDDYLIKNEYNNIDITITDKVVSTLDVVLKNKRLISYGFIFKDIHKKLNLDDVIDGDLKNTDNEKLREDLTDVILKYQWHIGFKNYVLH